jgi:hypothetical protein
MPIANSFRGHGTFVYLAKDTVNAFGSAAAAAQAMAHCGMRSAWVRVHGRTSGFGHDPSTRDLVAALRAAGIAVAGWGWCQGDDPAAEAQLAIDNLAALNISDYVADIEEGVNHAHWTTAAVADFLGRVRAGMPATGSLAVSSFPVITWHSPELMKAAEPFADAFAPQTYWFHFPNAKMQKEFGAQYPLDRAASYVDLCLADWRSITAKPLIATGQAYWGEGIDKAGAEAKVVEFLHDFTGWPDIVGFNWWYFGGGDAMSKPMRDAIAAAGLAAKPFHP